MNTCLDELVTFCDNIKILRKKNGLSQASMSKRLRIGVATLRKLEHGIVPPHLSSEILFRIQKEFGIHPSLLFLAGMEKAAQAINEPVELPP